jgi:hypothetical protein
MNDVGDLETSETDIADPPQLVIEFVALETLLGADMGEHTVPLTLPDVERQHARARPARYRLSVPGFRVKCAMVLSGVTPRWVRRCVGAVEGRGAVRAGVRAYLGPRPRRAAGR